MLAAVGGARLDATLASVAWASERVVLDPAGRVDGGGLPPGVRHVPRPTPPSALAAAEWLLLVLEGETAMPGLAAALAARPAAEAAAALAVPVEEHALGTRWTPRRAPRRLAPRRTARLVVREGRPELAAAGRGRRLAEGLRRAAPATLADALAALDADSAALAAWLAGAAARARFRQLVLPPLAAAARVLLAPGERAQPWARWVAAVFAGYRTLVVPAKLWELAQAAGGDPRPREGAGVGRG